MDYGQFKGTDKQLKIINWVLTIITLGLCVLVSYTSIETNINKAIVDYDRGKYKVEFKVSIDTIRIVKKCPELYKHTVPYVTEPQPMRFIPPMNLEKEQELQDSLLPYSQLDSLK